MKQWIYSPKCHSPLAAVGVLFCVFLAAPSIKAQPLTIPLTDVVPGAQQVGHTRIAAATDGSVALAVEVRHSDEWKVAVQRYGPSMQPVGPLHFFVGCGINWTGEFTELPELAFHPSGHLVVLAQQTGDYHLAGDSWNSSEVHIGLIDPQGQRIDTAPGSSDCVETFLYFDDASRADRPRLALTPSGEMFAIVDGFFGSTNYRNVAFQVFDSELNEIEDLRKVIPHTDEISANALHWYPDVATNGSVLISTWQECPFIDNHGNYEECSVHAQFASLSGTGIQAIGGNLMVNAGDPAGTMNFLASAAMDAAGHSIVVWYDGRPAPHGSIYGQRFNASGQPIGANFQISAGQNPFPSTEEIAPLYLRPEVAMLGDGRFMVTWTEQAGSIYAAMGRRYSPTGTPLEPPAPLIAAVSAAMPHVEASGDAYVLTWLGIIESEETIFLSTIAGEPVSSEREVPADFALHANYPNPFNPATSIRFDLPAPSEVRLEIFDVLGRRVALLHDGTAFPQGKHEATLDASGWSSGVYLYRLDAGPFSQTRRMTLLK